MNLTTSYQGTTKRGMNTQLLAAAPVLPGTQHDLENRIKELEGLIHIIGHNLRGSAADIRMLTEILIDKNLEGENPEPPDENTFTTHEALEYIQDNSNALLETLGTIMEVADMQLSDKARSEECDIAAITDHVTRMLQGVIHQKKATIITRLSLTHITYPKAYMESILYNFINNAVKYSNPDVPLEIIISTYTENGRAVLTVKDNGIGIDLDAFGSRIFKLNQVFHSGYESKGIGLYITKTQIESMGGSISVQSKVNEGSEFIVIF